MSKRKKFREFFIIDGKIKSAEKKSKLVKFQNTYFKKELNNLHNIIDKEADKEENISYIYDKILNFCSSYVDNHGAFSFDKIESLRKDISFKTFWRTEDMYYIKENSKWFDMEVEDWKIGEEKIDVKYNSEKLEGETKINKVCLRLDKIKNKTLFFDITETKFGMSSNKCKKISKKLSKNNIELETKHIERISKLYKKQNYLDIFINKYPYKTLEKAKKDWLKDRNNIKNQRLLIKALEEFINIIEEFQNRLLELWEEKRETKESLNVFSLREIVNSEEWQEILKNETKRERLIERWKELGIEINEANVFHSNPNKEYLSLPVFSDLIKESRDLGKEQKSILIKSENYQAMNTIKERYKNKVKSIYIDPPYNTKKLRKDYKDKYKSHSWLTMIKNRLEIAKEFLTEDGSVLVSIDVNENYKLRMLMNEIFGKENFVTSFVWKRRSGTNISDNMISTDHEYVVCYSKNIDKFEFKGIEKEFEGYNNPDDDPRGPWKKGDLTSPQTREQDPESFYEIENPENGKKYKPNTSRVWAYSKENMKKLIEQDKIIFPDSESNTPYLKRFKQDVKRRYKPISSHIEQLKHNKHKKELQSPLTRSGTKEIQNIFGEKAFSFAKPVKLIKQLIDQTTQDGDIVMDFFAGSGTTGQAVLELCSEKDKEIEFILIEKDKENYRKIKKRLNKIMYSSQWKKGKPKEPDKAKKGYKSIFLYSYLDRLEELEE